MKGDLNIVHLVLDLGSSTFRAGVSGREDFISEPCVIAYDVNGDAIIGTEAAQMIGRNPDLVKITTPIQWGAVNDFSAVVDVIRHVAKTCLPGRLRRKFTLTMAIPSGLTQVERKAMVEAGKTAGAKDVTLVNSGVAAAWGAGLPIQDPVGCLVVSLGAGVTEAAILSMKGIVDSRSLNVGGRSIDHAIIETLKKDYSFLIGQLTSEQLKRRCDSEDGTGSIEVKGRNLSTGLPDSLKVPCSLVQSQWENYCNTIVDLIVQTLASCPPELVGDIMDRGIVLVGGGARSKGLVKLLMERTEVPMIVADDPENCVIRGLLKDSMDTRNAVLTNFFSNLSRPQLPISSKK